MLAVHLLHLSFIWYILAPINQVASIPSYINYVAQTQIYDHSRGKCKRIMLHCKWDVSAAIHIHVILADINREDERFLLGASLHIPRFSWLASMRVIFLRRQEKREECVFFRGGWQEEGRPRCMASSLWRSVSRSFYLVDPL